MTAAQSPRRHVAVDPHDAAGAVDPREVEREPHPERVDRAGARQQQRRPGDCVRVEPGEPAQTRERGGGEARVDAGERDARKALQAFGEHAVTEPQARRDSPPQPSQRKPVADGRGASGLAGRPSTGTGWL